VDEQGNQIIINNAFQNLFPEGHPFNVTGYISPRKYMVKDKYTREFKINENKIQVFRWENFTYDYSEHNEQSFNVSVPIADAFLLKNLTMYLHVEIESEYRFMNEDVNRTDEMVNSEIISDAWFKNNGTTIVMHRSVPLIRFTPLKKKERMVNLLGDSIDDDPEPEEEEIDDRFGIIDKGKEPEIYIQHLKPNIYCYISPDTTIYKKGGMQEEMKAMMKLNTRMNFYEPLMTCTDYWTYKDILIPLNDTLTEANTTIYFQPYSSWKVATMNNMEKSNAMYAEYGMSSDQDGVKKLMAETNFYLLLLTMVVSLAHTVCEFMAVKNEFQFWKNRDSLKGISVRTLFINLVMMIIIFLYLLDRNEETSYMILFPAGIGIAIE
jgi:hypothetical protein